MKELVFKDYYDHEPMNTQTKNIDGVNVLFQYGKVVPSFDTFHMTETTRHYINLNGEWRFKFDTENIGYNSNYFGVHFDDSDWQTVQVPHCYETMEKEIFQSSQFSDYGKGGGFTDGFAWYRKSFTLDQHIKDKAITLKFLGTYYSAWIFINGEFVGAHENGHTAFSLDISQQAQVGENVIAIRILRDKWYKDYTAEHPEPLEIKGHIVHTPVDYWPYGGITRDVYIEVTSKVYVSKILLNASNHKLEIKAVICNDTNEEANVNVEINPGERTGGQKHLTSINVKANSVRVVSEYMDIPLANYWNMDHPNIYEASVFISNIVNCDRLSGKYGMRKISIEDTKVLLNGKRLFLKGINWHEETFNSGRAMTKDEYDVELGLMKESGAIFLRNCVYNRHKYAYEYCDQHGLLMLDDIDNMWVNAENQKYQTEEYGLSRALALKMAWNNMNHPSVIMWCVQNECDMSEPTIFRAWVTDMVNAIRSIDIGRRPILQAQQSIRWDDPSLDICDIIGVNEYLGTHHENDKEHELAMRLTNIHKKYPHKPILITENGAWSRLGDEAGENWHIERFNVHYNQALEVSDFNAGFVMWVFKDYKTRHPYARKNNGVSSMGIVTFDTLERKKIFDVFKNAKYPEYHNKENVTND